MPHRPRIIRHGLDARTALLKGAEKLTRAVAVTYGPGGRTAIIDRFAGMLATKDGVTVAREIDLENRAENMGALIVREACIKVNDEAGDGTTSAAILAGALLGEGHKLIIAGYEPRDILAGMRQAADEAIAFVREISVPVENQHHLEQVALIACNGDEDVASNMAEACMAVGKDGTVLVEDSNSVETLLEFKEGMELDTGAASPHFLVEGTDRVIDNPLVAVISKPLSSVEDVREVMECASQWPDHPLLILAPRIDGGALTTMVMNHTKNVMQCCAVKAPGVPHVQRDYLEDIAILAAADFVDPDAGYNIQKWEAEWFGSFRKATISSKTVTLEALPAVADDAKARVEHLRGKLASITSGYDEDRLRERMAKLSGGMAILKIGGITEAALKERRARVEDALGAVRASLKEGLVPGGGVAYLRASQALEELDLEIPEGHQHGFTVMKAALTRPLLLLASNAGIEGAPLAARILKQQNLWMGWDVRTGELRDLSEDPYVVDPTTVVCSVIDAAASVAATLLSVETSVELGVYD